MHLRWGLVFLSAVLTFSLTGCFGGSSEPSEAQMRDAMEQYLNHPPGVTLAGDPIKIVMFKKEACDNPTPQGYNCTFTVNVTSKNALAQMYNNVPKADFYMNKDSGKWTMRPPF